MINTTKDAHDARQARIEGAEREQLLQGAISPQPQKQEVSKLTKAMTRAQETIDLCKRYPKTTAAAALIGAFIMYTGLKNKSRISSAEMWKEEAIQPLAGVVSIAAYGAIAKMQAKALMPGFIDFTDPSRNLTKKAKEGKLLPAPGRDDVIQKMCSILGCYDKPNVLLVGPPGVGKTAIVEAFAGYLTNPKWPVNKSLQNVEIISIKASEFVEGSAFMGQFEERIRVFIEDLEKSPHLIVFIDELHSLAQIQTGTSNIRDILKPMLARGKARIIGCTTTEEVKILMHDGAFNRRFQRIDISEPTKEGGILRGMLTDRAKVYATRHQCVYTPGALQQAIDSSEKQPGFYPDKALALLDQAGAAASSKKRAEATTLPVITESQIRNIAGDPAKKRPKMMTLRDLPQESGF